MTQDEEEEDEKRNDGTFDSEDKGLRMRVWMEDASTRLLEGEDPPSRSVRETEDARGARAQKPCGVAGCGLA